MVAPAHNHTETAEASKNSRCGWEQVLHGNRRSFQELTLWMGTGFTRPHGGRLMILPADQIARALPRQTWIDFCAVLASVLHRNPPQEPAKDRTAPLWPITLRRPSQRLNHQILRENSRTLRNRAQILSQRTQDSQA